MLSPPHLPFLGQTCRALKAFTGASYRTSSPPSVAERRKWVPYFLMRLSVISLAEGLRPRCRMLRMNSGVKGRGEFRKSRRSTARLLTFQRPNSLQDDKDGRERSVHRDT